MLNIYKISFNSLIVALVALQQSYAIQALDTLQWDEILQEAYCTHYECEDFTADEAISLIEHIQTRKNTESDRYATIQISSTSLIDFPAEQHSITCLLNRLDVEHITISQLRLKNASSTQLLGYISDLRALAAVRNLQLRI